MFNLDAKATAIKSSRSNMASTSLKSLQRNNRLLTEDVPPTFDWSTKITLSSVKSIGYCAASWAFAAAGLF